MNPHVNAIAGRLSLRSPQRDSLEILAHVCDLIALEKQADSAEALDRIQREFFNGYGFRAGLSFLVLCSSDRCGKDQADGRFHRLFV